MVEWCLGNDTGVSSERIMRHMLGLGSSPQWGDLPPSDEWDRGRCIRLLNLFPEWWDRLDEMRTLNISWNEQIDLIWKEKSEE